MAVSNRNMFLGGVLAGAVAAPVALFSIGWIVTSGAADAAAKESAEAAMLKSLTPICVSQFSRDVTRDDQLAKLKALSQWDRPDFVAKSGWATMPGSDAANSLVADACSRQLSVLE